MMQFLLWVLILGLLIWLSLRKMGLRTYSKSTQRRVSNPQPSLPLIKEPSTSCERPSTMPNRVRTWEAHVVLQNGDVQTIEVNVHKKASKYTVLSKVLEAGGHPKQLKECENVREVRIQKASGGKSLLFVREGASLAKAVKQGSAKEGTNSASNTDTKYLVRIMPTHMSGVDVRFHLFAPRPEDALTGAV